MTIEAILQRIDEKLGALLALSKSGVPAANDDSAHSPASVAGEAVLAMAGATPPTGAEPPKRGRGRPPKGEQPSAPATTATQTTAPVVSDPMDFLSADAPAEKSVSLPEVKAALAVYMAQNDQTKALALFKQASGVDTLAQLKPENYGKVFKAAIPAGKLELTDVRAVLVKAQERVSGSGLKVLKETGGVDQLPALTEDKFAAVINAASQVK